jgi:hypothetical protein
VPRVFGRAGLSDCAAEAVHGEAAVPSATEVACVSSAAPSSTCSVVGYVPAVSLSFSAEATASDTNVETVSRTA